MKKSIELFNKGFQSSSNLTNEFKTFYRTFKSELKKELESLGCKGLDFNIGHFYAYGFFMTKTNQIYYFSISDVRHFKDFKLLYRTAETYRDFTGGTNQYVNISDIKNIELV